MGNTKIDNQALARIRSLNEAGWSLRRIAAEVGVCHAAVRDALRRAVVSPASPAAPASPPPPPKYAGLTPADLSLAERLEAAARLLSEVGEAAHTASIREAIAALRAVEVEPEPEVPVEGEPVEIVTALLHEARRDAARHAKVGNASAASRSQRTAAMLAPVVARLAKDQRSEDGGFFITRAEVDQTRAELKDRIARVLERPLLCAHCNRQLSVSLAEAD